MRNDTRQHFTAYQAAIARANDVPSAADKFNVTPSVQQILESKVQDSDEFLKLINIIGVPELTGQKIGMGITTTIAGRTNTDLHERQTRSVHGLSAHDYQLAKTDFDTHLKYEQVDIWAKFKDFQLRLRDMVNRQIALDRIKVGFHGTSVAAETDPVANPLLQDVNIGWLEQYRLHAPERVLDEVAAGSGKVLVGASVPIAQGYKTLGALVFDAINGLIHPAFRGDPRIRVILSPELQDAYLLSFLNRSQEPTEQNAAETIASQARVGLVKSVTPAYMPAGSMLITMPENLSIYWQEGSMRRQVIDNPKRDRIEDFRSQNEGYVVEQYEAGCLIENIELVA
ncbi:phage major capsid protein, P2 family [Chitiniphilus eburneus]|uniref:phage major capsid protein, P2 family n=1 Tax=Chitiniphilus eburneus TaxID=2571148 RepID=UPI0035D06AD5